MSLKKSNVRKIPSCVPADSSVPNMLIPLLDDTSEKFGKISWFSGVEGQTLSSATPFLELHHQRFPSVQKHYTKTKSRQLGQFTGNQKKKEAKMYPKYFNGHLRSYIS